MLGSPWIGRANPGWLARTELAAWILPLVSLRTLLMVILNWLADRSTNDALPMIAAVFQEVQVYVAGVVLAAIWLLTAREPSLGAGDPGGPRLIARWGSFTAALLPLLLAFLPPFEQGGDYVLT